MLFGMDASVVGREANIFAFSRAVLFLVPAVRISRSRDFSISVSEARLWPLVVQNIFGQEHSLRVSLHLLHAESFVMTQRLLTLLQFEQGRGFVPYFLFFISIPGRRRFVFVPLDEANVTTVVMLRRRGHTIFVLQRERCEIFKSSVKQD